MEPTVSPRDEVHDGPLNRVVSARTGRATSTSPVVSPTGRYLTSFSLCKAPGKRRPVTCGSDERGGRCRAEAGGSGHKVGRLDARAAAQVEARVAWSNRTERDPRAWMVRSLSRISRRVRVRKTPSCVAGR